MRPIAPRLPGTEEQTYAEEQGEYLPITVALTEMFEGARYIIARYTLTDAERRRIAEGEDLYFGQLNFGGPMTPIRAGLREDFAPGGG
jgi:hypothetical protein